MCSMTFESGRAAVLSIHGTVEFKMDTTVFDAAAYEEVHYFLAVWNCMIIVCFTVSCYGATHILVHLQLNKCLLCEHTYCE